MNTMSNNKGRTVTKLQRVREADKKVKGAKGTPTVNMESSRDPSSLQKYDPDEVYNDYLASLGIKHILKKSVSRIESDIDKQLADLQKRVKQDLDILEETREKISAVSLIRDQTEILQFGITVCDNYQNEPAFVKEKNFSELMTEIDKIRNQMPCKNIFVPDSKSDVAMLQKEASQLLESLEQMCAAHGANQASTATSVANLQEIGKIQEKLGNDKKSAESIVPKACSSTLKEVASTIKNANLNQEHQ